VAPLSSSHPVATCTYHRSARHRPAWLFFFLLLSGPHSPRPSRVADPFATVLAKVLPCATLLLFVRVGPEQPRFTSVRARPNRARLSSMSAAPPRACATHSSAYRARQARAPTLLLRPPSVRTLLLPLQPSRCFRCAVPSSRACSLLPSEPAAHGLARPRREPLARLPARPPLHLRALARATAAPSPAPCVHAPVEVPCITGVLLHPSQLRPCACRCARLRLSTPRSALSTSARSA
jgi:hypothetical protein